MWNVKNQSFSCKCFIVLTLVNCEGSRPPSPPAWTLWTSTWWSASSLFSVRKQIRTGPPTVWPLSTQVLWWSTPPSCSSSRRGGGPGRQLTRASSLSFLWWLLELLELPGLAMETSTSQFNDQRGERLVTRLCLSVECQAWITLSVPVLPPTILLPTRCYSQLYLFSHKIMEEADNGLTRVLPPHTPDLCEDEGEKGGVVMEPQPRVEQVTEWQL